VLSQGEPRDAAVNFDTYRILQRHRAVLLPQLGFLAYISNRSNAEITHSTLIFTAVTQNHGDSRKSRHKSKIPNPLEYPRSRLRRYGSRSFAVCDPTAWNCLPAAVRDFSSSSSSSCFCGHLKTELFCRAYGVDSP